ncbi:MAG: PEGA domain-containing protein [bacterium]
MHSQRITLWLVVLLIAGLLTIGCDDDNDITGPTITTGALIIESYPSGATYALAALQATGTTPDTLSDIEAGRYGIVLSLDGYHTINDTIAIRAGETRRYYKSLSRGYGAINFVSIPPGATVHFNQTQLTDITPFIKTDVPAGRYPMKFTKAGYGDKSDSVTVLMDDTVTVSVTLDLLLGWVHATSVPTGADIYFGNHPIPRQAPATDSLPPGNQQIRAELGGYHPATQTVIVREFETTEVTFNMVLITGTINITSTPIGAEVYVNGLSAGVVTPAELVLIPETYTLSLRKAGYYDWDTTTAVTADQTSTVDATLLMKPTSITITSSPSNVAIAINGTESGFTTPHTFSDIASDQYLIRLTLPGHFPADTTFTTTLGEENRLYFSLASAPNIPFAYTQDTNIYLANMDGIITNTLATDYLNYINSYIDYYGEMHWSPDGTKLAYTGRTEQVSIIREDGAWINGFSGNRSMDFCWSPDSDELVWGVYCGGMYKNILSNNWYGQITSGCYDNSPAFSPDGTQIMFMYHNWGRYSRIDLVNSDGSSRRNIYGWFGAGFDEYSQLAWTTGSTAIFKIGGTGIYEACIPDSGSVVLTQLISDGVSQVRLSPDRQWCGYNTSSGLYLMQVGVWAPDRITSLTSYNFSIMAGGEYVTCRTADGVHVVTRDGKSYHIIVDAEAGLGAIDIKPN